MCLMVRVDIVVVLVTVVAPFVVYAADIDVRSE